MVNKYASHVVIKKDILDKAGVTESSPVEAKAALLKGLTLGTTGPGAAPDNLLRFLISKANLDPEQDTQLVGIQGGGQALLASMERGVIDGFCLSSPTSDIAVSKFGGGLFVQYGDESAAGTRQLSLHYGVHDREGDR